MDERAQRRPKAMSVKRVLGWGVVVYVCVFVMMPNFFSPCISRERVRQIASLSNLKQIGCALMMYGQDYDGRLPPLPDGATARRTLAPYLKNDDVWRDPRTGRSYEVNRALSGAPLARFAKDAARVAVFYETLPTNGARAPLLSSTATPARSANQRGANSRPSRKSSRPPVSTWRFCARRTNAKIVCAFPSSTGA
jgi:hypothetical protein